MKEIVGEKAVVAKDRTYKEIKLGRIAAVNKNTIKEKHTYNKVYFRAYKLLHFEHLCKYLQFLPKVHFPILNALHK
jgi:hypothetical protein